MRRKKRVVRLLSSQCKRKHWNIIARCCKWCWFFPFFGLATAVGGFQERCTTESMLCSLLWERWYLVNHSVMSARFMKELHWVKETNPPALTGQEKVRYGSVKLSKSSVHRRRTDYRIDKVTVIQWIQVTRLRSQIRVDWQRLKMLFIVKKDRKTIVVVDRRKTPKREHVLTTFNFIRVMFIIVTTCGSIFLFIWFLPERMF